MTECAAINPYSHLQTKVRKTLERKLNFSKAKVFKDRYDWIAPFAQKGAILDLGCIDERHPERIREGLHGKLKALNANIVGGDLDLPSIEIARKLGFDIRAGNAEHDSFGGPFDLVIAAELIEHLDNPGLFLKNVRTHLKPGGQLLLTTPNPFYANQFAKILKYGEPQVHAAHRSWFSPDTLQVLLEQHGFHIEEFVWFASKKSGLRRFFSNWRAYWNEGFGVACR